MKKLLYVSMIFAAGCASSATRHVSSAQPEGQKFTCTQYKAGSQGPILLLWVKGNEASVQQPRASKIEHYKLEVDASGEPGSPGSAGRTKYQLFARVAKECPANYDCGSLEIDTRMQDGSWSKNVISNRAGHAVFPDLHFAIREGHSAQSDDDGDDISQWDCDPNDQVPTY